MAVSATEPLLGSGVSSLSHLRTLLDFLVPIRQPLCAFLSTLEVFGSLLCQLLGTVCTRFRPHSLLLSLSQRLFGFTTCCLGTQSSCFSLSESRRRISASFSRRAAGGRSLLLQPFSLDNRSVRFGSRSVEQCLFTLSLRSSSLGRVRVVFTAGPLRPRCASQRDDEVVTLHSRAVGDLVSQADHQPPPITSPARSLAQRDPLDLGFAASEMGREPLEPTPRQVDDQTIR